MTPNVTHIQRHMKRLNLTCMKDDVSDVITKKRFEAINEFAERLKEYCKEIIEDDLDKLTV